MEVEEQGEGVHQFINQLQVCQLYTGEGKQVLSPGQVHPAVIRSITASAICVSVHKHGVSLGLNLIIKYNSKEMI